jgi:SAM-dependent methyltransferase
MSLLMTQPAPTVLEAGCGSTSHLPLPADAHLVGIDISENQLRRDTRLHERILGDLCTHRLPRDRFDLVVCWDVLEHLPEPVGALRSMFSSVKPGGLLVVAMPNLWSLKGMATKLTPFAVHRAFYRYVIGDRRPPSEFDQFPTYLRMSAAPRRVLQLAVEHGFEPRYFRLYQGPVQTWMRARKRWADRAFGLIDGLSAALSARRWNANHSDCLILLQRRADGQRPPAPSTRA